MKNFWGTSLIRNAIDDVKCSKLTHSKHFTLINDFINSFPNASRVN